MGKRALPALDLSIMFRPWLETILHPEDIVMGFGPPQGDDEVRSALDFAHARNALTFALPGMMAPMRPKLLLRTHSFTRR